MSNQSAIAIAGMFIAASFTGFFTNSQLNIALAYLCAFGATIVITLRDEQQ